MKHTKEILKHLAGKVKNIDYYFLVIDKIEKNVQTNPDISIESCKSLYEGLFKFILSSIDASLNSEQIERMTFQRVAKLALSKLAELNGAIDLDFLEKSNELLISIRGVRNRRGDLSHGKLSPKTEISDEFFSNLVMQTTDSFLFFILTCFSQIEIKTELLYEDNNVFNVWLDGLNPLKNLSYSKALFHQDKIAYEQELLVYNEL